MARDLISLVKVLSPQLASSLRLYGDLHRFIRLFTWNEGFRVGEIKVHHRERPFGVSKYGAVRLFGLLIGWPSASLRLMAGISMATTLLFITFATHNYGGVCQGPRWAFWLIPFGLFGLPWYIEAKSDSRFAKAAAILVLELSVFSVLFAIFDEHGPWSTS